MNLHLQKISYSLSVKDAVYSMYSMLVSEQYTLFILVASSYGSCVERIVQLDCFKAGPMISLLFAFLRLEMQWLCSLGCAGVVLLICKYFAEKRNAAQKTSSAGKDLDTLKLKNAEHNAANFVQPYSLQWSILTPYYLCTLQAMTLEFGINS